MLWRMAALATAGVLVLGAGAAAQGAAGGYLGPDVTPDTVRILPPPPAAGSPRYEADRRIFRETRALQATPRWTLATADADQGRFLEDQACALGAVLTPANAPRTLALLTRLRPDLSRAVTRPKDLYKHPRPYLTDPGPTCIAQTPSLAASPDYPSGHASFAWTVGLILAELAPDRATPILVRARAFGESRLICGVHTMSAVEAGRTNASALVAALHGSAAFRSDLDAARAEVAAARKAGPAPPVATCAAEAALIAASPY
jgi:acid phosphatase (class A)